MTTTTTTDLNDLLPTLFTQALQGLLELAQTTDKDHIKLHAYTALARLCQPKPPLRRRSRSPGRQPRRRGGSPPSPDRPCDWERAGVRVEESPQRPTGPAPTPTPSLPDPDSASPSDPSSSSRPSRSTPKPWRPGDPDPDPILAAQIREDMAIFHRLGHPIPQRWHDLLAISDPPPDPPPDPPDSSAISAPSAASAFNS